MVPQPDGGACNQQRKSWQPTIRRKIVYQLFDVRLKINKMPPPAVFSIQQNRRPHTTHYLGAFMKRGSPSLSASGITCQLGDFCARCHLKSFTSSHALVMPSKPAACRSSAMEIVAWNRSHKNLLCTYLEHLYFKNDYHTTHFPVQNHVEKW